MLREYELTVIFNSQLNDEDHKKTVEKYEEVLFSGGGEVVLKQDWGVKKLSFPIKNNFRGRYIFWDLTTEPDRLKEAERLMRFDEGVLRYMSLNIGENVDVPQRKADIAKAEAAAARQAQQQRV